MDIPATTTVAEQQPVQSNKALLDRAALAADASLHASSRYEQVGVDAGNGWQRQENGGVRGSDWFGGAQAAVLYIVVNDPMRRRTSFATPMPKALCSTAVMLTR
jgi:hypothetical protein